MCRALPRRHKGAPTFWIFSVDPLSRVRILHASRTPGKRQLAEALQAFWEGTSAVKDKRQRVLATYAFSGSVSAISVDAQARVCVWPFAAGHGTSGLLHHILRAGLCEDVYGSDIVQVRVSAALAR